MSNFINISNIKESELGMPTAGKTSDFLLSRKTSRMQPEIFEISRILRILSQYNYYYSNKRLCDYYNL